MSARRRIICWCSFRPNPGNPALCLSLSQTENVMPGTATCGPFGESGTYVTRSGQTIQGTRGPFSSQFAAVTYQKTIGNSNYNCAGGLSPSCQSVAGIAAGLHLRQISRSVFQSGRGGQSAQPEPEQGALGFRHAAQLRRKLQLEAAAREAAPSPIPGGRKGGRCPGSRGSAPDFQ